MQEITIGKTDELVMKLLHYFITEEGYTPIILHGAQNEIWLENLENDYKIIRIVSNYIHNDEQFKYDLFKTNHILKKIKRKTFSFGLPTLSIFVNLGENVHNMDEIPFKNIYCIELNDMDDLNASEFLKTSFPTITKENNFKEEGAELFIKLTCDINKKSETEAKKNEDIFAPKKPIVTYILLVINTIFFLLAHLNYDVINNFVLVSNKYMNGEFYRIITSTFLHYSLVHFLFNMYALYIIGTQLESFLGKIKYTIVYLLSGISGSLLSMAFLKDGASLGASGAIFGLLGSLVYFGYHYRVYLGTVIKSQIIPLILINLLIGFTIPGIDNSAHIGGLIGGILSTIAVGVKYKSTNYEKINGFIVLIIYMCFLAFLAFKMA